MIEQPTIERIQLLSAGQNPLELSLLINEVFYSIQGEGSRAGMPCIFIRLHGCKLRCSYCDTQYAIDRRKGGTPMTGAEIHAIVEEFGCTFIEFTGGEPLEQWQVFPLMQYYCDAGYTVAVETGGHIAVEACDERVIKIMDLKTPGSKMASMNFLPNLQMLQPHDEVKFVIGSREDYEWSKTMLKTHQLQNKVQSILFSPEFGKIQYREIVEWILSDHLPVRLQLQMHKFIWDPITRGV